MPLASQAVDRIFARMAVRYGSAWAAKWDGLDIAAVKADWANELEGIPYDAIVHALGYLPADFPPTVTEFRRQCIRAPHYFVALPPPKPSEEEKARIRALLAETKRRLLA